MLLLAFNYDQLNIILQLICERWKMKCSACLKHCNSCKHLLNVSSLDIT